MIVVASRDQAAATRRDYTTPDGAKATVDTYIGTNRAVLDAAGIGSAAAGDPAGTYPMAYIVSQAPGSQLRPHFHQADQFQVFIAGSGRIGTHAVQPLTVHFAAAHSPYGPIVAGSEGLQYLTLRRSWDPGAQYMPESAPKLRAIPGRRHRTHTSEVVALDALPLSLPGASRVECLFAEQDVGAWLVALGPRAEYAAEVAADRFAYVLAGEPSLQSHPLSTGTCLFASADEGPLRVIAGASGASLLLAQFPPA